MLRLSASSAAAASMLRRCGRVAGRRRVPQLLRRDASSAAVEDVWKCRNVGVLAHIDAGKTTTTERMLALTGHTAAVGAVDAGNTVTDFMDQERERGITIQSAVASCAWGPDGEYAINVIDTPGHVDFTAEVEKSLHVLDGALLVLDAVAGVQAQTETVWRQAGSMGLPAVAFVNKMDRDGASYQAVLRSMRERLGITPLPIQLPIGQDQSFQGVVDVLALHEYRWHDRSRTTLAKGDRIPLTPFHPAWDHATAMRRQLIATLAELDEAFMELYLEKQETVGHLLTDDDADADAVMDADDDSDADQEEDSGLLEHFPPEAMLGAIRRSCLDQSIVPVLCGSSLHGVGVEPLLDSIVAFLPSPAERPPVVGTRHHDKNRQAPKRARRAAARKRARAQAATASHGEGDNDNASGDDDDSVAIAWNDENVCAQAFKVVHDRQRGPIVFLRVFSGTLSAKQQILNTNRNTRQRLNQLLRISGDDLSSVGKCPPGSTVAALGLKGTATGDTFVETNGPWTNMTLHEIDVPEPVFAIAVEPESTAMQATLDEALQTMHVEDPSLQSEVDSETGQTILKGVGELHLQVALERLKREFSVNVHTGRAYVAYRETVRGSGEESVLMDRHLGSKRLYAGLTARIRRSPHSDVDIVLHPDVSEQLNAQETIDLMSGLQDAFRAGPIGGFPVSQVAVTVTGLERNAHTSSGALRACAAMMVPQLMRSADAVLMEPVMAVELSILSDQVGAVVSDLSTRRGHIVDLGDTEESPSHIKTKVGTTFDRQLVHAKVPLATMLGYSTHFRSVTAGEGSFTMEFSEYEEMDEQTTQEVVNRSW